MGSLSRRVAVTAGVASFALALPTAQLSAVQGRLASASLRTAIPADSGTAHIHLDYVVAAGPAARDVPVTLLLFDGTPVRNIITRVNGVAVDPVLRADGSNLRLRGAIPLLADVTHEPPNATTRATTEFTIAIEYEVAIRRGEPAGPLRLPILAVMWPPATALPGTFHGEIEVPAGLRIYDPFPANFRPLAANAAGSTDSATRYAVELPVLPAMIAFSLAPADQPVVTLANVLAVSVVLAIAVTWTLMWRQFRREA
jgi:hypothetical protein